MRHGIPVIFGSMDVPSAIRSEAARRHSDLRLPERDFRGEADGNGWRWRGRERRLGGLVQPGLLGAFQVQNAAAVLALIESLKLSDMLSAAFVNDAWRNLTLRGRLQAIQHRDRHWLLDVAHNPDAARVLGETMQGLQDERPVVGVFGVLADKDIGGILRHLCPVIDCWIAVPAGSARAMSARELAAKIANTCNQPCRIAASIAEGLDLATELSDDNDTILVTGSFFTVGPALQVLNPQA